MVYPERRISIMLAKQEKIERKSQFLFECLSQEKIDLVQTLKFKFDNLRGTKFELNLKNDITKKISK